MAHSLAHHEDPRSPKGLLFSGGRGDSGVGFYLLKKRVWSTLADSQTRQTGFYPGVATFLLREAV